MKYFGTKNRGWLGLPPGCRPCDMHIQTFTEHYRPLTADSVHGQSMILQTLLKLNQLIYIKYGEIGTDTYLTSLPE
jgi:hypothetical protein